MQRLALKIPPLLLMVTAGVVIWLAAVRPGDIAIGDQTRYVSAICLFVLGAFFNASAVVGFKRAKTTVNPLQPHQSRTLVDSGIYGFTRNPMYVGFFIWLIAWALCLANVYSLLVAVLFVPYINQFQIKPEEQTLDIVFGEHYRIYKNRVRRWL